MANEASTTNNSVSPEHPKENDDQISIVAIVSTSISIRIPSAQSFNNRSTRYCFSKEKTFKHGRQAFLSAPEAGQRVILHDMVHGLEIPFALENIYCKPPGNTPFKIENLDEIMDPLLITALDCARDKKVMQFAIVKRLDFQLERIQEAEPILDDWFRESNTCRDFLSCNQLVHDDLGTRKRGNKWRFLEGRTRKEFINANDYEEPQCCIICIKELENGPIILKLPCSHVFHGTCIFHWFLVNPTCPLCSSEFLLEDRQDDSDITNFDIPHDQPDIRYIDYSCNVYF